MSAFYVQHQQHSPPATKGKIRQEGFHLPASPSNNGPPPPNGNNTNPFDPNLFFGNGIFPADAFRKFQDPSPGLDLGDSLGAIIPDDNSSSDRHLHLQQQGPPPHLASSYHAPHQHQQQQLFDPNFSYSLPVSQEHHQPQGPPPNFFDRHSHTDYHHNFHLLNNGHGHPSSTTGTPDLSSAGDPFSPQSHPLSHNPSSIQQQPPPPLAHSPPNATSRSRSRTRNPTLPAASRSRVGKKRASISSPSPPILRPSPPPGTSGSSARPQAIHIPNSNPAHNPHSASPMALHNHPPPSAWFMQQPHHHHSASEGTNFSMSAPPDPGAFMQTFSPHSMGASPKSLSSIKDVEDAATKQAAILNEKRRRRRESHNAVERRRRDNINEKITELSTLIPECMLDAASPTGGGGGSKGSNGDADNMISPIGEDDTKESAGVKANKGMILRKSVDYIRYLQQIVKTQADQNRLLESELAHYRGSSNPNHHPDLSSHLVDTGLDSDIKPALTGISNANMDTSPSVGSFEDDEDEREHDERERGRGKVRGLGGIGMRFSTSGGIGESALSEGEMSMERRGGDDTDMGAV